MQVWRQISVNNFKRRVVFQLMMPIESSRLAVVLNGADRSEKESKGSSDVRPCRSTSDEP